MVKVVEFPEKYMYKGNRKIATADIGEFTGDRKLDRQLAIEKFKAKGIVDLEGYVIHHDYKKGILQLIDREIHKEFSHYGGYYLYK